MRGRFGTRCPYCAHLIEFTADTDDGALSALVPVGCACDALRRNGILVDEDLVHEAFSNVRESRDGVAWIDWNILRSAIRKTSDVGHGHERDRILMPVSDPKRVWTWPPRE